MGAPPPSQRYVLPPVRSHPSLWRMYKQHMACFWTVEELDLSRDKAHWDGLTDDERHFVKHILAFFAASDGIVVENLAQQFMDDMRDVPEARFFYGFQVAMENVHSEMYTLLLDTYIQDPTEKASLFNAIEEIPCIKAKADWALSFVSGDGDEASFGERLVAFACVEGIMFSGAFCAVFWLKKRGLMEGLTRANELISRDEGLHCDFACELKRVLGVPITEQRAHAIVREAVELECAFVCEALSCRLIGMNSGLMAQYVKFVADRLLDALGFGSLYDAANPFEWMEAISMQGKANFFETRETSYQKANVLDGGDLVSSLSQDVFSATDDF